MRKTLVTGGAGFIGTNFVKRLLKGNEDMKVYVFDKLTYAGDIERIKAFKLDSRLKFIRADVCDLKAVREVMSSGIDTVVHFAAESHVDRSINDVMPFVDTNVRGTVVLLDVARLHGVERFVHISTDEVYGDIKEGKFTEGSPLCPNSPYSASKAGADVFAGAYHHTYGLPVIILRPSNNYGPWQYPEKLVPLAISRAIDNKPVPVYASGQNVREWIYVEDCTEAIFQAVSKGKDGEAYNVGSGEEKTNIEVVKAILAVLGKPETLIEYVEDRPGHDFRYSMDSGKIERETGWKPKTDFETGIEMTVKWYLENGGWWRKF